MFLLSLDLIDVMWVFQESFSLIITPRNFKFLSSSTVSPYIFKVARLFGIRVLFVLNIIAFVLSVFGDSLFAPR